MKKLNLILLLFIILSSYTISKDYNKMKVTALKFTQELIANPENIENILKDSSEINSRRILEREYSEFAIKRYKAIILSQNKADFEFDKVKVSNINGVDSSFIVVNYIKQHNIFYNIFNDLFYKWFVTGCSDNVDYNFIIKGDSLYFLGIQICQHMDPSELE